MKNKMKRNLRTKIMLILMLFIWGMSLEILFNQLNASQNFKTLDENVDIKISSSNFFNATVISDLYGGIEWNDDFSQFPSIATDKDGNIHVVWVDYTDGPWGIDGEIMYANYTSINGWSNVTVISDLYGGIEWNDHFSYDPSIAIDTDGDIHVVWEDYTSGPWGFDSEIMYVNHTSTEGWSNATVISDLYGGIEWNYGNSRKPSVAVDNGGNIHVVWEDGTDGPWGIDYEIMYCNHTSTDGWSNVTVISDLYGGIEWNFGGSFAPSIAIDTDGDIHVVWEDGTNGPWGSDYEIMYCNHTSTDGWSNAIVISDDSTNWNDGGSYAPSIAIDTDGDIHVVWDDSTVGIWGGGSGDREIMYVNHTSTNGWSNSTIISDLYDGIEWNSLGSYEPSLAIDNNDNIHVVWEDRTDGQWGTDTEIMYVNYIFSDGWSNVTVISDGYKGVYWNDGDSWFSSIAVDTDGDIHIVWYDDTNGLWGNDQEIMYAFSDKLAPNITINLPISGGLFGVESPHFDVSIDGLHLDSTWYTLDNGLTNITFDELTGKINQDEWGKRGNGTVTISYYANDTRGNIGFAEVTVRKDIILPKITIYSPNQDAVFGIIAPEFNISIDDANLISTWYTIDNGINNISITESTGYIDQNAWSAAPEEPITIRFYAKDIVNNIAYEDIVVIKKIVKFLSVNIVNQSFSTDEFNITVFISNESEIGVDFATIQMWWNESDVTNDIQNLGSGLYFISLEPITVTLGEDPILLSLIVSANGFEDKHFETYLAVDPEILKKGLGKDAEDFPLTIIIITIASIVGGIGVITIGLLRKRKLMSKTT